MTELIASLLPEQLVPHAGLVADAVVALAIFIVGWIASKWLHAISLRMMRKAGVDEALARFLGSIAQYVVLAMTVVTALQKVGVPATSFVAILGAAGLAIGLALQGTLSNFAAGVMILLFRPFTIGHRVTVADHTGVVEEVGIFATTLMTPANETIIIPNGEITSSSIVNYTVAGLYRVTADIGVAYGVEYAAVEPVILQAISKVGGVVLDKKPDVVFASFGASSLDLVARAWCDPGDASAVGHGMRVAIYAALAEAKIEIPFNQLVVHKAQG